MGSFLAGHLSNRGVVCPLPFRVSGASCILWRNGGFLCISADVRSVTQNNKTLGHELKRGIYVSALRDNLLTDVEPWVLSEVFGCSLYLGWDRVHGVVRDALR